jgi:hypothetical protein
MNIHQFKTAEDVYQHLMSGQPIFGIRKKGFDIEDVVGLVSVREIDRAALVSLTDEAKAGRMLADSVKAKCRQLAVEFYEAARVSA